ncbi:L-glyceraldehyde 3-phosphate reductase [Rhizosaccharibacter radicis]|uniref:L-glyceraldehyde 3-phosphate reductase n=1 Tax=Rhizosaccharibacter radicis TaxID=2782605 RepID=A0ABT1VXG8_9PROT|nr:L-glyceraldehyde 3-phosphate reductase [Acetobacteraceae bacterium KSS12]
MSYQPDRARYDDASFRRCGRSGLKLPPISLGLWHNFGGDDVFETGRAVIRRAFDRGITHFDLANNYGPPYGSAEENFGHVLRKDFGGGLRDELVISSKAGWDMWPGPYGIGGSRKYLLASLDQSLKRMGLDYVDIFYSHRPWDDVPLEETMGALVQMHRQGKALYVGISSYGPERTREAERILRAEGVPLLIHQPSYSMLNRWIEKELLGTLDDLGVGCIAFSPLAQGLLTSKYLNGVPEGARAGKDTSFSAELLSESNLDRVRALNAIAERRGQTLAQMAIAWTLRDPRVTSALIGARNVRQLDDSLDALKRLDFSAEELSEIDRHATEGGIDLWRGVSHEP